jgi:hypothetical protein
MVSKKAGRQVAPPSVDGLAREQVDGYLLRGVKKGRSRADELHVILCRTLVYHRADQSLRDKRMSEILRRGSCRYRMGRS